MGRQNQTISVIIPTLNASALIEKQLTALKGQTVKPLEVMVIDSSSEDDTAELARSLGAEVVVIPKEKFDHGGTRTLGCRKARGDILVYLTQDALPVHRETVEKVVKPFLENGKVAASFGRQIPYPDATPFGAHLRLFNYPKESRTRGMEDKDRLGIRTAFMSNSFAGYRRKALQEIGGFKDALILGEDTCAGAKLLLAGYRIAYVAEAEVLHSHNYKMFQEFKRYFDVGVFHRSESWILETFGKASGEGLRYVLSEMNYLVKNGKWLSIPRSVMANALKYAAYKLGYNHKFLPRSLARKLSMNRDWWYRKQEHNSRQHCENLI